MTTTRSPDPDLSDDLLPAERKVLEQLGHMALDFRAMGAISNIFRSSTAVRRHMEAKILGPDRLSWTSFVALWVLWVWGEMGANEFASAIGISRPTATGVIKTLQARGLITRRRDPADGRAVIVALTPEGRQKIEHLFPRYNAEEVAITAHLAPDEQTALARHLRSMVRLLDPSSDGQRKDAQKNGV